MSIGTILTIVRTVGGAYSTFRLVRAAVDALQQGEARDYLDIIGDENCYAENNRRDVGITYLRYTIKTQEIPERPRGQFVAEFLLGLNREVTERRRENAKPMPVKIELIPLWMGAMIEMPDGSMNGPIIELAAGTIEVNMPPGEASVAGFLHVDAAQAYFAATPRLALRARLLNPSDIDAWTDSNRTFHPSATARSITVDFDYVHLPWE